MVMYMRREQKLLTLLIIMCIYIILVPTFILPFFSCIFIEYINPFFWLTVLILFLILDREGYKNYKYNRYFFRIIFYITLIFTIIFFSTGFVFGFKIVNLSHTLLSGTLSGFFRVVLCLLIEEYLRYYLISGYRNKKYMYFFITVIFIIIDLLFKHELYPDVYLKTFSYMAVQSIGLGILCSYLASCKTVYGCYLVRTFPFIIYILIPVMPDCGFLCFCIIQIIYYVIVYCSMTEILNNLKNVENKIRVTRYKKIKECLLALFITIVLFIIGIFPYVPLSITNNDMADKLNYGDEIIYKKINNVTGLKKDDIIVFIKNNSIKVRRIQAISIYDGKYLIISSSDNGGIIDTNSVDESEIIGLYVCRIPFVGYPSAWLHKMLGGQNNA